MMENFSMAGGPNVRSDAIELFCSYSTEDEEHRAAFERSLAGMRRAGHVTTWSFRKITAGQNLDVEINAALTRADLIVLLVSSSFLNSDYCWNIEMRAAVGRHDRGEARIVPVIVRSCHWADAPFARLNALPTDAKPVSSWSDSDEAWTSVAHGIRAVVDEIRAGRQAPQIVQEFSPRQQQQHRDPGGLLTSDGAMQLVLERSSVGAKPLDDPLLLYENSFQRTWLIFLPNEVVCVLDDVTKGRLYDPIRWRAANADAVPVRVRPYRSKTGLVDFGSEHSEWLYSLHLHPDPTALRQRLEDVIGR